MAGLPINPIPPDGIRHPRRYAVSAPKRRQWRGLVAAAFRRFAGPAAAFVLLFPTIGYYTLAAYSNILFAAESSMGSILIRAGSLAILILAWLQVPRTQRRRFLGVMIPATLFIFLYSCRLLENMLIEGMDISPGNELVLLTFFLSAIIPAYMLASMERAIRDEDMIALLSLCAVLFVVGMALNYNALTETAERRMTLDKINPISLAYVASSLMLFYLLSFARSKRSTVEALLIVPILLLIVALARSRGMLISTGITLLFYVLVLKGSRRVWTLSGLGAAAAVIGIYANPDYIGNLIEALYRIDVYSDMSTASRAASFHGAWGQFIEDPIFGRYAVELQTNYYPHNIYLESLMSVGMVGTVPFLVHFAMAVRAAFGLIRETEPSFTRMFIALLFVREAVAAAASGGLWGASGYWITSFLVITMWYGRKQDMRLPRLRELRSARQSQPKVSGMPSGGHGDHHQMSRS